MDGVPGLSLRPLHSHVASQQLLTASSSALDRRQPAVAEARVLSQESLIVSVRRGYAVIGIGSMDARSANRRSGSTGFTRWKLKPALAARRRSSGSP